MVNGTIRTTPTNHHNHPGGVSRIMPQNQNFIRSHDIDAYMLHVPTDAISFVLHISKGLMCLLLQWSGMCSCMDLSVMTHASPRLRHQD